MIRAMRLDVSLYEEVEKDENAMNQAVAVVVISSICAGIGSMISSLSEGGAGLALVGSIVGMITALIGWFIWSFVTYFVGTRITKGQETKADYGELLRTIGFSSSPGVINILSFIPLVSFIVGIWQLAAMIVAVRQALDFTTNRAILTCILGWITYMLLLILFGGLMAIPFLL
ncbi:MAG: YIP1 family protein [Candidatus Bathyarchaeota archaeon]|nr:MAG: YIP1 family protein [Candidatus Bathyarchaeota archaeon]